jgi:hypothetical protein
MDEFSRANDIFDGHARKATFSDREKVVVSNSWRELRYVHLAMNLYVPFLGTCNDIVEWLPGTMANPDYFT